MSPPGLNLSSDLMPSQTRRKRSEAPRMNYKKLGHTENGLQDSQNHSEWRALYHWKIRIHRAAPQSQHPT